MRFRLLGNSGLRVSELCLGTMTFGEEWGWGSSKDESRKVFEAFAEAGGNFIDTANFYTGGSSETMTGEFLGADRERWVLATKYTCNMFPKDPNGGGNHRKNMVQSVEASLKRLKTDYIDLYWLHAWDATTPVEEVMRGLDDLVRAGKVLYIGVSDTPAWEISRANTIAELRGWTPFVGLQIEYSLLERTSERDLIPMAKQMKIGLTAWSPLAAGQLTGKYSASGKADSQRLQQDAPALKDEKNLAIVETVKAVASQTGKSPAQVALNWVRQRHEFIPIIGARRLEQVKDNLACVQWSLSEEQIRKLDDASAIDLGFPHEFLQRPRIQEVMFGESASLLDR